MSTRPPHVLIVEDASNWRTTLETLLKSYGFVVHVASNVLEACAELQHGPFTAAILDVRLDSFDEDNREGVTTVLAAAHRRYPDLSFIVISSYYSENEVRSFASSTAKLSFFDKNNFQIELLLNTLKQLAKEIENKNA